MKPFKNILYVAEETVDQVSAVERSVSMAENNQAGLTVIDVIPPVVDAHLSDTVNHHKQKLASLIEPYCNRVKIQIDVLVGTILAGLASLYNRKRFISGKLPVHAATGVWERVPK